MADRGFGLTAEKMRTVRPRPKVVRPLPTEHPVAVNLRRPQSRMLTADAIKVAADRAEERSKKNATARLD
jgi:hypothetical protein